MSNQNLSHWNYRVYSVPSSIENDEETKDDQFLSIRSTYYNEDDSIAFFDQEPASPVGETLEELKYSLSLFEKALSCPIVFLDKDGNLVIKGKNEEII